MQEQLTWTAQGVALSVDFLLLLRLKSFGRCCQRPGCFVVLGGKTDFSELFGDDNTEPLMVFLNGPCAHERGIDWARPWGPSGTFIEQNSRKRQGKPEFFFLKVKRCKTTVFQFFLLFLFKHET